jgi:serine/threonine protein phosphatase PrpC
LATAKGNVRSENQDYGLCFQIAGHQALVMGDGCGGVPHGQRAAYLASVSAAVSIIRTFARSSRWHAPCLKSAAQKAIADAGHRLAIEGDKLNISEIRGGLRTTLIVVVANKRQIGYGYIGDGGGCVVHSSGEVQHFLKPQKANEFAMNVLAASLGPMMEGQPVAGVLKRSAGDVLVVGTDGIFDRVDKGFPKDVLRGCIQFHGDLQKTAEHVIQELASFQDGAGYICDDNLTLGIMGDRTAPSLCPGFWSSSEATEERPAQVQPGEATLHPKE